jgi:hypothetical protein
LVGSGGCQLLDVGEVSDRPWLNFAVSGDPEVLDSRISAICATLVSMAIPHVPWPPATSTSPMMVPAVPGDEVHLIRAGGV